MGTCDAPAIANGEWTCAPRDDARSAVPDLLFEDVQAARLEEIEPLLGSPELVDLAWPLHRVTLFATYRCNLACGYCKTIVRRPADLARWPHRARSFSRDRFQRLLDAYRGSPIRHVHVTGGEGALVPDLPDMVRLAKERGVGAVSMTTNGTLESGVYERLAAAGLDEIRVSLDAADGRHGDRLTRRSGAWVATVATIRALTGRRHGHPRCFVIANTVTGPHNFDSLPRILRFVLGLGPGDVKLIAEVESARALDQSARGSAVVARVRDLVAGLEAGRYPLLRRKLDTIFDGAAIGLEHVVPPADKTWRCYVALTELTLDATYYYPCSVYVREAGAPLGLASETAAMQRRRIAAFVSGHDCLRDPICRRYCLHCTREFNELANRLRP